MEAYAAPAGGEGGDRVTGVIPASIPMTELCGGSYIYSRGQRWLLFTQQPHWRAPVDNGSGQMIDNASFRFPLELLGKTGHKTEILLQTIKTKVEYRRDPASYAVTPLLLDLQPFSLVDFVVRRD